MWMKVDDGLHAHRKTRAVTKSHPRKRRDAAPMGIWVLAGSWAAQNRTDGWVPEDELDRFDEDWEALVSRLVAAGYWWPAERDGEAGYGFNDWLDYNPESEAASRSGMFGNHVRWHANKGVVDPECDHCPKEPNHPESDPEGHPESGGDIGGRSGGESGRLSRSIALPQPDPTPARPDPKPSCASADAEREFDQWYDTYPRKRGRGQALKAYRSARKKASAEDLLLAIKRQTPTLAAKGPEFVPYPATWLNGERWLDDLGQVSDPFPADGTQAEQDAWVRRQPKAAGGWS